LCSSSEEKVEEAAAALPVDNQQVTKPSKKEKFEEDGKWKFI
jgi:hypothetical protein